MRKLIATVFNFSLDGLLADEGTEFWELQSLPETVSPTTRRNSTFSRAPTRIMGRTAYEAISASMTTATDLPTSPLS